MKRVGFAVAGAGLAVAVFLCGGLGSSAADPVPPSPVPAPAGQADGGAPAPRTEAPRETVRITFQVVPSRRATVTWGKKRLGMIGPGAPLVVQRPRDSGPLDVVIRADGFLPVQTRAFTFSDSRVAVRLTPVDQKHTLLGYKQELPPEADGGVPD